MKSLVIGERLRPWLEGAVFVLLVAGTAHLLYSHLGFNPTDEGYMLSGSRRILDGEVPHRDYISLRPVGTHLLHAHLLLWAGDRLMWWSRGIAWLQLAVIAWLWVKVIDQAFCVFRSVCLRFAMGIVAFAACAHTFPIMPWNSIDGLLFLTVGIAIRTLAPARWWWVGVLAVGAAPLFRQNLALPIPLLLLVLNDARRAKAWLLVGVPCALYGLLLVLTGGLDAALVQLRSHGRFLAGTLLAFQNDRRLLSWGFILGFAAVVHAGPDCRPWGRRFGIAAWLGAVLYTLCMMPLGAGFGWFPFSVLLASTPCLLRSNRARGNAALLSLICAWGTSISVGYPSPALASGPLLLAITAIALDQMYVFEERSWRVLASVAVAVLSLTAAERFHHGRTLNIYRDWPSPQLSFPLDGILRGATGIYTNPNTYAFLKDLDEAARWASALGGPETRIAIVPGLAQFWVSSPSRNPLSSDWAINDELIAPGNRQRVLREIDLLQGKTIFLVQKYGADYIAWKPIPIKRNECAVCEEVRSRYHQVLETPYFLVFR